MNGRNWIIILFLLTANFYSSYSAGINGKIKLSDEWRPVVYLSHINSFDDLNTASYHLLIAESDVDEKGYFSFDSLNIPEYDQVFRLHVCKWDDPVSTIIIGGQEQNHLHFLMNSSSVIEFDIHSFYDFEVIGHPGNSSLMELFDLKRQMHVPLDIPSEQNRKLHKEFIKEQFVSIAEKSEFNVNRLLAVYLIHQSFDPKEFEPLFEALDSELSQLGDSSHYFDMFHAQVQFLKYNRSDKLTATNQSIPAYYYLIIPLLGFLLFRVFHKKSRNAHKEAIADLSIQEKKVYELLQAGKSNKEISSELHIEVSTVKSHVYKIFSKLGLKSRKELIS